MSPEERRGGGTSGPGADTGRDTLPLSEAVIVFLFLEALHRQYGEKSSTTASATAAGELVISVLWEVSVCRLGALCTHRSSRH